MSLFRTTEVVCPVCSTKVDFKLVDSVNADRRPDLRQAILDGNFQQVDCPKCKSRFRLDSHFNVLDIGRGQWIAAEPVVGAAEWKAREDAARELFSQAYGEQAGELAREVGAGLKPRLVFGWPALRERLLARDHDLDDVAIEGCKATAMRNSAEVPFSGDADLRLVDVKADKLVFAWVNPADNTTGEMIAMPRTLHDEIAADEDGDWYGFKTDFEGALYVDLNRMLVAQPA
ncbi:MAG: CpXC domain-containing protein [Caldimonas sp.]